MAKRSCCYRSAAFDRRALRCLRTGLNRHVLGTVRTMTKRPVAFRRHPGQRGNPEPDFSNVWACVTWGSGAGIKALAAGIPVFNCFEHWIGKTAATPLIGADLEKPFVGDRLPMFQRYRCSLCSMVDRRDRDGRAVPGAGSAMKLCVFRYAHRRSKELATALEKGAAVMGWQCVSAGQRKPGSKLRR